MNDGHIGMAFVSLLRARRDAERSYLNSLRAQLAPKSHLIQQQSAVVGELDAMLAEAVKLLNAISARKEWIVQTDGTVRVEADTVIKSLPTNEIMEGL